MICSNCGRENPGDTRNCTNCNTPLNNTQETVSDRIVQVRVSRLAITAIIFAILGPIIFSLSLIFSFILHFFDIMAFAGICISVIALILGIISFVRIEASGGKITGLNFSLLSIIVPIFAGLFLIVFFMFFASRSVAYRMACGSNLAGLGKAMLIYANDYGDELPYAGGPGAILGTSVNYKASNQANAYNITPGNHGSATISSSLYLLVKYTDVEPKRFICSKDLKVTEFYPESVVDRIKKKIYKGKIQRNVDIISYWDFGAEPWKHNSYAYHMPYGQYPLKFSSKPGMAIMADRNPWISSPGWKEKDFSTFNPDGDKSVIRNGNNPCHQYEGQNVLFLNSHVDFQTVSFCGLNKDNIYTLWNGSDIRKGTPPVFGSQPASNTDSLLVNDSPPQKR